MQLPNVEQLDSEDKNWFARAIAGMVVADGRVDESETAFLKEALGFLEDRSQVEQIMGIVKQGSLAVSYTHLTLPTILLV